MTTPAPDGSDADVLDLFSASTQAVTPRTTEEIVETLDRSPTEVLETLEELADDGRLASRETTDGLRLWWRPSLTADTADRAYGRSILRQFGAFVDAVSDYAIFMLDPEGHVVSWNEGAERIKGYAEEEILGEHFSIFYPDEQVEAGKPEANLRQAAAEGRAEDQGWRLRADGSRFLADIVLTAVREPDGELAGFIKVTRDLTEPRAYEAQLRQERDLVEGILETTPASISVLEPDGSFVRANSRALERLGLDADELEDYDANAWPLFDEAGELIPPEERPWAEAVRSGEPVLDERCQVELPEIGRRWLSINAAPLDVAGASDRVVMAIDDITARVEREETLQRQRDQTEKLLRTAPIAIAVQDADGETIRANPRAREILDLTDPALIDQRREDEAWRLIDRDGNRVQADETPAARVRETGEAVRERELALEDPSGTRRWFSLSAVPVEAADGSLERVVLTAEEITQLKRHAENLERRTAELETELGEILGRISDAFYALDRDWRFTHVNQRAAELLGGQPGDFIGAFLWERFPETIDTEVEERYRTAMETQEPVSFEIRDDQREVWLEINAYPSETGLSVYFRDVTNRKEREGELGRYRTIVRTVEDGIYTVDLDGRFTMVNEAYVEMTGYSREELLGSHVSLVVDEETVESAGDLEERLVEGTDRTPKIEAEIQRADGSTVPAEATFALFPSNDERIGVVRDITERRARERAIKESERRYRTLAENFPDGVVALFDTDLEYTAAGGQLLDDLGVDPEEAIGESVPERYPDHVVEQVLPHFQEALGGTASEFEIEYYDRHLYAHTLPIRDAEDAIDRGMLVAQDITERVEYREQLEESNRRLEQFAHIASHDLQEPLRMVSSYLSLLEDRYGDELDGEAIEFIDYAVDGAERMREMIQDLLAYSRLDNETGPIEPVELKTVVESTLASLEQRIEEESATVHVGDLPTVAVDANQLEMVFQNLIGNAIKYQGERPPEIEIGAERENGTWRIRVTDNGIGIDPAYTDQIFEIFQRLHGQEDYPGTGIGLALCRKIVRGHDGEIWVESEPGEGSTFYFTLPADREN